MKNNTRGMLGTERQEQAVMEVWEAFFYIQGGAGNRVSHFTYFELSIGKYIPAENML